MPFDTLQAAKSLEEAGVESRQAEAMVATFSAALTDNMATKADVERLEGRIDTHINRLEGKIDTHINRLEGRIATLDASLNGRMNLLQWMFGTSVALTVAILLKLFLS